MVWCCNVASGLWWSQRERGLSGRGRNGGVGSGDVLCPQYVPRRALKDSRSSAGTSLSLDGRKKYIHIFVGGLGILNVEEEDER